MTTPSSRRPNSQPRPWEVEGGGEVLSFGAWLRRQREMREVGLREIADSTKISIRYLEALEQDRFEILPAPVFARGFLREYAKYVGLSPDEVVNYYLTCSGSGEAPMARAAGTAGPAAGESGVAPRARPAARDWQYAGLWAAGLVALVGVAAWLAHVAEARQRIAVPAPPPLAVPAAAVATAPAAATPPAIAPLRLHLEFQEDCWVERVVDGAPRLSELRVRGETLQIDAQDSVVLTLGHPRAVRLVVNGALYPLPQDVSAVVRDLRIDRPALAAGTAAQGSPAPGPSPGA